MAPSARRCLLFFYTLEPHAAPPALSLPLSPSLLPTHVLLHIVRFLLDLARLRSSPSRVESLTPLWGLRSVQLKLQTTTPSLSHTPLLPDNPQALTTVTLESVTYVRLSEIPSNSVFFKWKEQRQGESFGFVFPWPLVQMLQSYCLLSGFPTQAP